VSQPVPQDDFFGIMSAFPTGVAVVTTLDAGGEPRGLTTNALCSVSADPPLLLVCVDKASRTLPGLLHSGRFVVNFLAERRDALAQLFASKAEDKFADVDWEPGIGGMPCLRADSLAYAECEIEQVLEAGDHVVLTGLVVGGLAPDPDSVPILYFRRTYSSPIVVPVE
jgi:flavin reductase (DIM6/NTAB) family NADH-FMN oxidoreductase RutF